MNPLKLLGLKLLGFVSFKKTKTRSFASASETPSLPQLSLSPPASRPLSLSISLLTRPGMRSSDF